MAVPNNATASMLKMITATDIFFALVGGILPALLWLWFWLREDRLHPEPRRLLMFTFFGGMLMVALALPLEKLFSYTLERLELTGFGNGFLLLFLWALAEEFAKYLGAKKIALDRKECDEPVDVLVYMIAAAIGFAAIENVIFLIMVVIGYENVLDGFWAQVVTSNLRFAGATLVHLLSSATVGASIAFCFFHKEKMHRNVIFGLFLATLLHALFNYFIIENDGHDIFQVFLPLWSLVIVLLIVFEKIKKLKKN